MPTVKVRDINMYYEIHGEGEPLVLICGLGVDLLCWASVIAEFSRGYKVITFDNRGSGRTDAPDVPYSIEMMADDTTGLLDTLGIEKAHILGHSLGSFIAQELALKYPHKLKSLTLASSSTHLTNAVKHIIKTWDRLFQEGVSLENRLRESLPWLMTKNFFAGPNAAEKAVVFLMSNPHPQSLHGMTHQTNACLDYDTRDRIHQISAPTLVIVGRQDLLMPIRMSKELAAGIPHAELVILKGGAHDLCGEIPDKFRMAVLDFLAKVDNTP